MNAKVRFLIDEARKLSPNEQSEIVDALVEGLPATDWYNQEDLAEWQRRAEEARADPSKSEDADKVMADLRAELKAMRR
jgi:putative addiction module component (TIGR02574 family)